MSNSSTHGLKKEIIKLIEKTKVVTTSEIASELKVSWNTAEKHLLELTLDNKITRMKKAYQNKTSKRHFGICAAWHFAN